MATEPRVDPQLYYDITGQGFCKDICLYTADGRRICGIAEVNSVSLPEAQRLVRLANYALACGETGLVPA